MAAVDTPEKWAEQFDPVPGSDAEVFIQWKGTELCMDLRCQCGADGHVDGEFAQYVRCGRCGAVYQLGTQVRLRRLAPGEATWTEPLCATGDEDEPPDGPTWPATIRCPS